MYLPGTSLFIKSNLRAVNIRTAPSVSSKAIVIGKAGDPAGGKFVGKFKDVVKAGGYTWVKLDYKEPRYIDSQLVQDIAAEVSKNQSVYSKPDTRLKIYESISASKPLIEMDAARLVGYVNRTVQTGNGTWIVLNPVGSTTVPWYVKAESVVTESQVREAIKQAVLNDQAVLKAALLSQNHINGLRKKGYNVDEAEIKLSRIMSGYQTRQKFWNEMAASGALKGSRTMDENTKVLWQKLKKEMGVAAINWVATALIALGASVVVSAIAVSVYKSFWVSRPDKASAIDVNLFANYNKEMNAATTDFERNRITQKYLGKIQDEKQKGFDEGKEAGRDEGFLNNLGGSFGTIAGWGVAGGVAWYFFSKS